MIEKPVRKLIAALQEKTGDPETKATVETVLRRGMRILPLSGKTRRLIGESYGVQSKGIDDDSLISMAFQKIDEPLIVEALLFQTEISQGIFDELFKRHG